MKKLSALLILISLSIFFIFSCQKDKTSSPTYSAGESNSLRTTVTGIVLDETNAPLNGVAVTAYGQTATTNQYGTFVFKNISVNKNRCVLQFSKTGFLNRAHGFIASDNTVNYVRIVLITNPASQTLSASSGGTISLTDGSTVDFQPNSFVTTNGTAYTGTVNIAVKHLSPDDANFGFMIPGGDLLGKDLDNKDVALYTYGMLGVTLTGSSGESLQLADNKTAILTMPIAASQLTDAPASIPLWYFDETTSLWKEEGAANKVGNNYVGTVQHFSWWNCDLPNHKALIKVRVVDCNGKGVPNVVVTENVHYSMMTDQNGTFQHYVWDGIAFPIQVLSSYNNGIALTSQIENVPALLNNQVYIVPDLVVICPTYVEGMLKTCTGTNTDGFVAVFPNTGFYQYQYTLNGLFSLIAPENSPLLFIANNSLNSTQNNITTSLAPNILNLGNVFLCDSNVVYENNITINGGPFSNQIFDILTSTAFAQANNFGISATVTGISSPHFNISYQFNLTDTMLGNYSWNLGNQLGLNLLNTQSQDQYQISTWDTSASSGVFNLLQVDSLGGRLKGAFSGQAIMMDNFTIQYPVTISGNFDVLRTQ